MYLTTFFVSGFFYTAGVGVAGGVSGISSSASSLACLILALIAKNTIKMRKIPTPIHQIRKRIFHREVQPAFAAVTVPLTILISLFGQSSLTRL